MVVIAELVAVLVAAVVMFPQVAKTFKILHVYDWRIATNAGEWPLFREASLPRGGELVLPPEVQAMVWMLRSAQVKWFRFSPEIARQGATMQRLVEGAYPIRVSEASPYLLLFNREPLPVGCSLLARQKGVSLAYCR